MVSNKNSNNGHNLATLIIVHKLVYDWFVCGGSGGGRCELQKIELASLQRMESEIRNRICRLSSFIIDIGGQWQGRHIVGQG